MAIISGKSCPFPLKTPFFLTDFSLYYPTRFAIFANLIHRKWKYKRNTQKKILVYQSCKLFTVNVVHLPTPHPLPKPSFQIEYFLY